MMNRSGFHWSTLVVFSLALSGCATFAPAKDAKDATILSEPATKAPKTAQNMPQSEGEMLPALDLVHAVGQAQTQRKMGDLQGATRALSQLVLVAPDDPRVLGEYGKTLVAMGRSDDALAFLERAIEIQPLDWSLFSAQGVAYDQKGNYMSAQASYEHALALKPGEPAVLSNNALSHMQAGDLDGAERLLLQAQQAGGDYPRVFNNLALVQRLKRSKAPESQAAVRAVVQAPATVPAPEPAPSPAPVAIVGLPAPEAPRIMDPAAQSRAIDALRTDPTVLMQAVANDPQAGATAPKRTVAAKKSVPEMAPPAKVAADKKPQTSDTTLLRQALSDNEPTKGPNAGK